ncbi:MAG: thioredoxin family protein [Myxococcales bacterium]|nr:thioredoxin family protein [Myxococcales bacterium]
MQAAIASTPPALVHLTAPDLPAVLAARGVTLLDFTAPWCAPCHALAPVLGELAAAYAGRARIAAIDVQDHPAVAQAFRVTSMPTLVLVRDGREVGRIVGLRARKVIAGALDRALAGDVAITGG